MPRQAFLCTSHRELLCVRPCIFVPFFLFVILFFADLIMEAITMRKIISMVLCLTFLTGIFSGCGTAADSTDSTEDAVSIASEGSQTDADTLSIIATIFPEYDWVKEIVGENEDNVELTMLLDNGVDLHSYQPTADDIIKISECDMFIYVGGESDEWVEDALAEATNEDMVVVNLLDVLGDSVKEEEVVEGMEAEEEEAEDEEEEEAEYDEHVWLSLKKCSGALSVYFRLSL